MICSGVTRWGSFWSLKQPNLTRGPPQDRGWPRVTSTRALEELEERVGMAIFRRSHVVLAAAALMVVAGLVGSGFTAQSRAQAASSPPPCSSGTLVQTGSGPVCGVTANGQTSYLDIPYAAPPLGNLRWRPAQPVQPWTTTYQATQRGPECLAPGFPAGSVQAGTSEDCLYLEVQKPAGARPGQNLPVMFEIHGGGFLGTALTDNG